MRSRTNKFNLIICVLWIAAAPVSATVVFDGPFPSQDYPFPVKDSGIEVRVDEASIVEWVENERVIFSALKPGEPRLQSAPPLSNKPDTPAPGRVVPILYPDGHIERLPITDKYSLKNSTDLVVLTRRGMVVTNNSIWVGALFPNKLTSGAYLVRGEQVVRLVDWLVGNERAGLDNSHRGLAVSPDGCKLAFKHGEGERRKVKHTIKMINLCQWG